MLCLVFCCKNNSYGGTGDNTKILFCACALMFTFVGSSGWFDFNTEGRAQRKRQRKNVIGIEKELM